MIYYIILYGIGLNQWLELYESKQVGKRYSCYGGQSGKGCWRKCYLSRVMMDEKEQLCRVKFKDFRFGIGKCKFFDGGKNLVCLGYGGLVQLEFVREGRNRVDVGVRL